MFLLYSQYFYVLYQECSSVTIRWTISLRFVINRRQLYSDKTWPNFKKILTFISSLYIYIFSTYHHNCFYFFCPWISFRFFDLMWNHITYTFFSFFLRNCYFVNPFFEICNIYYLWDWPASISLATCWSVRFDCK